MSGLGNTPVCIFILARSILILFVSVLHLCIFKEKKNKTKLNSLCTDTSEGLSSKTGPNLKNLKKYVAPSCF